MILVRNSFLSALLVVAAVSVGNLGGGLALVPPSPQTIRPVSTTTTTTKPMVRTSADNNNALSTSTMSRKDFSAQILAPTIMIAILSAAQPQVTRAEVSDGSSLPQGAQQFTRVLRLKSDLQKVKARVADSASEIDKKEWDSIGQFLRQAYSVGEDMKAVAGGVANPENKKRALQDVDQLKKYAQAGDVSVNKKDAIGFIAVADKMLELVNDFFDSLNDIPDEI